MGKTLEERVTDLEQGMDHRFSTILHYLREQPTKKDFNQLKVDFNQLKADIAKEFANNKTGVTKEITALKEEHSDKLDEILAHIKALAFQSNN